MNHSEQLDQIGPALVAAQAEMGPALKDSNNPFFNSKYADLTSVMRAASGPLANNGLALTQMCKIAEPYFYDKAGTTEMVLGIIVETVLLHSSGQWISGECYFPLAKRDPQAVGSATTYGRRYGAAAILGMVQDDDDGNAGSYKPNEDSRNSPAANYNQAKSTPPPAPAAVDYLGHGEAKKKEAKLKQLCTDLHKSGSHWNGKNWNSETLNDYCIDGFDTPLALITKEELAVLLVDLEDTLKERQGMQEQSAAPATDLAGTHTGPSPATEKQINACVKMAEIKDADEKKVCLEVTGNEIDNFKSLSGDQAVAVVKHITKMKA